MAGRGGFDPAYVGKNDGTRLRTDYVKSQWKLTNNKGHEHSMMKIVGKTAGMVGFVKPGGFRRNVSFAYAGVAAIGVLTASLGASGKAAYAQTVYGITNTGKFGYLDLTGGGFQQLGTSSITLYGLAYDQTNNGIFAIDDDNTLYQFTAPQTAGNGNITLAPQLQFTGLNGQILQSIAFDKQTNTLYGLASDNNSTGTNATLYRLSTTNSAAVRIGTGLGFNSFGGFAVVTSNGVSTGYATQGVAANNTNGPVFQINLTAGTSSLLGGQAVAGFANPVSAIAGVGGSLKAVDYTNRNSTQNATYNVGLTGANTGVANVQAFYDMASTGGFLAITDGATPEPGTIGLLSMGLTLGASGVVVRRRRKNK